MRRCLAVLRTPTVWVPLLVVLGIGIPTLWYPFGRDQSLYHYVGREWLHGAAPYRDAFDQKPPLIYVIHALGIWLFGAGQWVIRVLDLCAIAVMGWACARLVSGGPTVAALAAPEPNRSDAAHGARRAALGICVASLLYFVYFDYWDTGQVEVWEGVLVILALLAAKETENERLACFLSGISLGMAFLFKFPALLFLPLLALVTGVRVLSTTPRGQRTKALIAGASLQVLGLVIPTALAALAFWKMDGVDDAWDVLVRYNAYYAAHKRAFSLSLLSSFPLEHDAVPTQLCLAGPLVAWLNARRGGERFARSAFWIGGLGVSIAVLSVVAQGKFYAYHWGIVVPFQAIFILMGLFSIGERSERRHLAGLAAMLALVFLLSPTWVHNPSISWPTYTVSWWQRLTGSLSRERFLRQFVGGGGYSYFALDSIGRAVEERKRPGDTLHVHGFEPIPYVISGLRSPSRFFAEFPLIDPMLGYRRDEWILAHVHSLQAHPPRFIVDSTSQQARIRLWMSSGYRVVASADWFVLLERGPQGRGPAPQIP